MELFSRVVHCHGNMVEGSWLDDGSDHGKFLVRRVPDVAAVLAHVIIDNAAMETRLYDDAVTACVAVRGAGGGRQTLGRDPGFQAETAVRHGLKRGAIERREIGDAIELQGGIDPAGDAGGRTGRAGARADIAVS